jgi:hypothetical protein
VRLFRPQLAAVPAGRQITPRPADQVGGLPIGLALDTWPRCAGCGASMTFVARFGHDADRLDLGAAGRALTLWQCERDPGACETWSAGSGANAAFVADVITTDAAPPPPDRDTPVLPQLVVTGWTEDDDGVPDDAYPAYFDGGRLFALGQDWFERGGYDTHLGGVPGWIQDPDEGPGPPWRFIGQLAAAHIPTGHDDPVPGPTFGDGGIAYLFLDHTTDPPRAQMFWQS